MYLAGVIFAVWQGCLMALQPYTLLTGSMIAWIVRLMPVFASVWYSFSALSWQSGGCHYRAACWELGRALSGSGSTFDQFVPCMEFIRLQYFCCDFAAHDFLHNGPSWCSMSWCFLSWFFIAECGAFYLGASGAFDARLSTAMFLLLSIAMRSER